MFSCVSGLIKDLVKPRDGCGGFMVIIFFFLVLKLGGLFPYIPSEDGNMDQNIV